MTSSLSGILVCYAPEGLHSLGYYSGLSPLVWQLFPLCGLAWHLHTSHSGIRARSWECHGCHWLVANTEDLPEHRFFLVPCLSVLSPRALSHDMLRGLVNRVIQEPYSEHCLLQSTLGWFLDCLHLQHPPYPTSYPAPGQSEYRSLRV